MADIILKNVAFPKDEDVLLVDVHSDQKAFCYSRSVTWVDAIPAADVAPVKHGRWKLEENWETGYGVYVHVCTACNAITPVNVSRYKYCPNCGAKMDGGVDDA